MKALINQNPRDLRQAVTLAAQARANGQQAMIAGGGSDLLGMVKERIVSPDVLIHLRAIKGLDKVTPAAASVNIGGQITLDALSRHPVDPARLRGAGRSRGQRRHAANPQRGDTRRQRLPAPLVLVFPQRLSVLQSRRQHCFSVNGENQFHAIFGGGPSFIVHPSDTAPALVALDAKFRIVGPKGERTVPASDFFVLPKQNAARENSLADDEVLASIDIPAARPGTRSTYHKVLDREAWTHAVVSAAVVLEMDKDVCRSARVVLGGVAPIPWRVPAAERLLAGQRITPELAAKTAETALAGATPLAKNAYKVPLTREIVQRTVLGLATRA